MKARIPTGLGFSFKTLIHFTLVIVALALAGCEAKGPDHAVEVAAQGLLSADLSAQGDYLVAGSLHHGGSLWDVGKSERLYNWNQKAGEFTSFRASGISSNGRVATTVVETDLLTWDTASGSSLNFWRAPSKVLAMEMDSSGRFALLGMQNNQAAYFDIQQGLIQYQFSHEAEIHGVALSADGRFAMTGSDDQSARLWRLEDGALVHTFNHRSQVKTVALSDDGKRAFSTAQREDSVIWDTASGDALAKLDYRYENFTAVRFSPDGRRLALGTFRGDIYIVDSSSGEEQAHWKAQSRSPWGPGSSGAILSLAFVSEDRLVAVSSDGILQQFSR